MTTEGALPGDDARHLLAGARELMHRVRRDQRANWFPLLVLAAVTFVAIPVDATSAITGVCRSVGAVRACTVAPIASFLYWPLALVLAYVAIVAWYRRRLRARGLGMRVWPYAVAGMIALFAAVMSFWANRQIASGPFPVQDLLFRLGNPGIAIGIGLLVLVRVERNLALLAVAAADLLIVLVPLNFGWAITAPSPWSIAPHLVIQGGLLLVAGLGFAVAQRRRA